ncbi:hypothetical protein [Streptomyces sp. NPDC001787]|uniref:hypothetical protein n=1 Tax=Streptomyces sp. NPDC001787 TaxID=3154523 RepID=UPI0033340345
MAARRAPPHRPDECAPDRDGRSPVDMSFAALALDLSMRDTGTLVTPYEAPEARAAAFVEEP